MEGVRIMRPVRALLSSLIACLGLTWVNAQSSGDVDGNGFIDQPDVEMLRDHLLQAIDLSDAQALSADCNGQTGIDAGDLVWIVTRRGTYVGPDMITVPAGSFDMGDPWNEGHAAELPVHTVTLSTYEISRFEVTNAEYAAFLNSAMAAGDIIYDTPSSTVYLTENSEDRLCVTHSVGNPSSVIEYSDGIFTVLERDGYSMDNHPVLSTWYGAAAYCNWDSRQQGHQVVYTESGTWPSDLSRNGYHLPTEAQWERAAAWEPGHGHWRYGFMGDTIDFSRANYAESGTNHANPLNLNWWPFTSPVGFYSGTTTSRTGPTVNSPSPVGCYDMTGNFREWCNDWSDLNYYSHSPETDPEGPSAGTRRVHRGGSWRQLPVSCRTTERGDNPPDTWSRIHGFRVARNP